MTARTARQETSQHHQSQVDKMDDSQQDNFIVDIGGLRMSTNYSFQVVPQQQQQNLGFGTRPSQISLQTKGCKYKYVCIECNGPKIVGR